MVSVKTSSSVVEMIVDENMPSQNNNRDLLKYAGLVHRYLSPLGLPYLFSKPMNGQDFLFRIRVVLPLLVIAFYLCYQRNIRQENGK